MPLNADVGWWYGVVLKWYYWVNSLNGSVEWFHICSNKFSDDNVWHYDAGDTDIKYCPWVLSLSNDVMWWCWVMPLCCLLELYHWMILLKSALSDVTEWWHLVKMLLNDTIEWHHWVMMLSDAFEGCHQMFIFSNAFESQSWVVPLSEYVEWWFENDGNEWHHCRQWVTWCSDASQWWCGIM